ncbi:MAG: zinc ABC transporter substrate-binding protein [Deltaproteobacteria bacterium]|nr:zinc ABC transporter substrate-binding protein [Deltaproteobacteria bacterium]
MKKLILLLSVQITLSQSCAAFAEELRIVTSLPSFASIAKSIGGDQVSVTSVAPAQFNPHFIEARPSDVLRLKRADLFIHGGLDLEAWRGPLVDAAARAEIRQGGPRELDLSRGIPLLNVPQQAVSRSQGDIHLFGNPHYWMSPDNGARIARSIAAKLSELDPANSALYSQHLAQFLSDLNAKSEIWKRDSAPLRGKEVLGYHDEWVYLMTFLGLKMERFVEPKPGIPPSPRQLSELEAYIKSNRIPALIQPTYFSKDAAESLNRSTGIQVLLLCQNVGELPECGDYLSMLNYDVEQIVATLKGSASSKEN